MPTNKFFRVFLLTLLLVLFVNQKVLAGQFMRDVSGGLQSLSMLRDSSRQLTLQDVSSVQRDIAFQKIDDSIHLGHTNDVIWIRLRMKGGGAGPERWLFEVSNAVFEDVRFYTGQDGDKHLQAGTTFRFVDRYYQTARPLFPMVLEPNEVKDYYLRIDTDTAVTTEFKVFPVDALQTKLHSDTLVYGMLIGAGVLSIMLSWITWTWARNTVVLFMAVSTIMFVLAVLGRTGLLTQYLFNESTFWSRHINTSSMGWFFATLFAGLNKLYGVRAVSPIISRSLWVVVFINLLVPIVRELGYYREFGSILYYLSWFIGFSMIIGVIFYRLSLKREDSFYSGVLVPVFSLGFVYVSLVGLGWVNGSAKYEMAWVFAGFGYAFLSQMSISYEARNKLAESRENEARAIHLKELAEHESNWRQQQARFFSAVAHEIRTPLSAIRMGLENLSHSLSQAPLNTRQRLARMQSAAAAMSDMLERHLQLQRILQSDFSLRRQSVPVTQLIGRPEALFREIYAQRELRVRLPTADFLVFADVDLVHSAVLNLLTNAAKYSEAGSLILMTVEHAGDVCRISITDSGPGLGEKVLESKFEVFWKRGAAENMIDFPSGMGIGLAFVNQIMRLHGGKMNYIRKNGLTTFSLDFPWGAA